MPQEINSLAQLTRWKEYFGTAVFVSALGLSLASQTSPLIWWKSLLIIFANFLAFSFAFMINDIEDAADDAMDPKKAQRNPISAHRLTPRKAYFYTLLAAALSLGICALLGKLIFLFGCISIFLGFIYSWKLIRLKSLPLVDLVSHALFLGTLELLAATLIAAQIPQLTFLVWVAATIFIVSVIGDLDNELRDYEVDRQAKLINTVQLLHLKPLKPYLRYLQIIAVSSMFIYLLTIFSPVKIIALAVFLGLLIGLYFMSDYKKHKSFFYYRYTESLLLFIGALLLIH